jgi:hypothetical protein
VFFDHEGWLHYLGNIPTLAFVQELVVNRDKGKFHISTRTNKVYNIEERKQFCSGFCFKASNFFRDQLDTSPLWLREREVPVVVRLYGEHQEEREEGEVHRREDIANTSVVEEVGDAIKKMKLVPKVEVDPVELVVETVQSWFTIDSYRLVEGEEKLRSALRTAQVGRAAWAPAVGDPAMEQQYQARYRDLARRLDMLEVVEEDEEPERLPTASFAMVRQEQETENLKMESFLAGRSSYTPGEVRWEEEGEGEEVEARLPLVDRSDQLKLRQGIVQARLASCLPPLLRPLGLSMERVRPGLRALVGSFRLLPTTVTLPASAWRLTGLLLLALLGRSDPALAVALQDPAFPGLLAPLGLEGPPPSTPSPPTSPRTWCRCWRNTACSKSLQIPKYSFQCWFQSGEGRMPAAGWA